MLFWENIRQFWEKNNAIFSKIWKVYLLNWDFSANLGMFQVNWEFFQPIGKKFGSGNRTQFCKEKKPCEIILKGT